MAEPQPPNVHEGADAPDVLPASAEDRKAAQAMSSLDAKADEDAAPKKEIDLKALSDAMKNLGETQKAPGTADGKKDEVAKKVVKVDAGAVTLLVSYDMRWAGRSNAFTDLMLYRRSNWICRRQKPRSYYGHTMRMP